MILDEKQQLSTDSEDLKKQVDEANAKIAELQEVVKNNEDQLQVFIKHATNRYPRLFNNNKFLRSFLSKVTLSRK